MMFLRSILFFLVWNFTNIAAADSRVATYQRLIEQAELLSSEARALVSSLNSTRTPSNTFANSSVARSASNLSREASEFANNLEETLDLSDDDFLAVRMSMSTLSIIASRQREVMSRGNNALRLTNVKTAYRRFEQLWYIAE